MNTPPVIATDALDEAAFPESYGNVHRLGTPHRACHIEIHDSQDRWLIWRRADGRWELPGGHLDWRSEECRPESYEEAALRETMEELNVSLNWHMSDAEAQSRLAGRFIPLGRVINQLPSSAGANNEWVGVYRLCWLNEWGDPTTFAFGEEGNHSPHWMTLREIIDKSLADPMRINSALRLFLARRNILIPLLPRASSSTIA